MEMYVVPTRKSFEALAESISNGLLYSKVNEIQAMVVLATRLQSYKLDYQYLKQGFAVRPSVNWKGYGFTVNLSVKDDDGKIKVMQFDFPEKAWREL